MHLLNLKGFKITTGNENVPIVVKMRGQPASDDVAFSRYGIFHHLTLFLMLMPTPSNFKVVARVEFLIFFENFNAVVLRID